MNGSGGGGDESAALKALRAELERAYQELADSNRGLLTLHAELDEKNDSLRRMVDVKTRVVANVSHEFRTPINSMLGITQILLDKLDGPLTPEQEKQLRFVRQSAEALSELVNDLLDLSSLEAGHHQLRTKTFLVGELFASLRGMMRPLFTGDDVKLVIEMDDSLPAFDTDMGKIAQILRNLVSNAVKFTPKGEVKLSAVKAPNGLVAFAVSDTGIGIARADQDRIFQEFEQIDGDVQRRARGTGLGLTLSRRLAEVLGGTLTVKSDLGQGATFTLTVPPVHEEVQAVEAIAEKGRTLDPQRAPILIIEDDRQTMFLYERYLSGAGFQVIPARTLEDARRELSRVKPAAIMLDVMLESENTWNFLAEVKDSPDTQHIPVIVLTVVDREAKARALGADEFWLKPVDGPKLIAKVAELARRGPVHNILVIDDDEASRYLLRHLLQGSGCRILEADNGTDGVKLARQHRPELILLDFLLRGETAFDVLDGLKANAETRLIPVVIQTSRNLAPDERARLLRDTHGILEKQTLSRELAVTRVREALAARKVSAGERA